MRILALILAVVLMSSGSCQASGAQQPADTQQPAGTQQPDNPQQDSPAADAPDAPDVPADPGTPADGADEEPAGSPYTAYFNKHNAWGYMEAQLDFGFRVPGTLEHRKCRNYLRDTLALYCDEVELQEFTALLAPGEITMWNIIGRLNPEAERRVMLMAHWDTRPTADKNPYGQRNQPIMGANDGASGVAVLLELARVFSENPPSVGVDFVLTDGEDYGPGLGQMFLGAEHMAKNMTQAGLDRYNYGILLDMIGDTNLDIHPEHHSESWAPQVYAVALKVSEDLGYRAFRESGGYQIFDDHLPFIRRGMRIYDFIDFNYEYWHTTEDTLDKCSPDSLEAVGRTVENIVYLFPDMYSPESFNGAK